MSCVACPDIRRIGIGAFCRRIASLATIALLVVAGAEPLNAQGQTTASPQPVATSYPSLQAALDANRGRRVYLPPGDYEIHEKLHIAGDRSGLFGPGRIIQTNAEQPIVEIEHADGAELRDVALSRPAGAMETRFEGVIAVGVRDVVIENVRVLDNRTRAAAIAIRECTSARVVGCLVRNYRIVTVEDRTSNFLAGYAFRCLDGAGIVVTHSRGTLIQGNRIVEENLLPTPETKDKFGLGKFVKKIATKPARTPQPVWDAGYTDNWNQGSGLVVTGPEVSDRTQILGNTIENAAQGIDLHADHVIVSNNIVTNCFVGMKAMHGSRNVLIIGNQFIQNDLWSIGLMPGVASHGGEPGDSTTAAREPNTDGGSIIANNIISDFGYGRTHWMWGSKRSPLKFDDGQQDDDPPLTDVVIQGNVIYDPGRQRGVSEGRPVEPPRYRYAVVISQGKNKPVGLRFSSNLFHPGTDGIANVELAE